MQMKRIIATTVLLCLSIMAMGQDATRYANVPPPGEAWVVPIDSNFTVHRRKYERAIQDAKTPMAYHWHRFVLQSYAEGTTRDLYEAQDGEDVYYYELGQSPEFHGFRRYRRVKVLTPLPLSLARWMEYRIREGVE